MLYCTMYVYVQVQYNSVNVLNTMYSTSTMHIVLYVSRTGLLLALEEHRHETRVAAAAQVVREQPQLSGELLDRRAPGDQAAFDEHVDVLLSCAERRLHVVLQRAHEVGACDEQLLDRLGVHFDSRDRLHLEIK